MIVLGVPRQELERYYARGEEAAVVGHPYAMPSQHFTVYLCREPKGWTLPQVWPKLKNWS
ncbi:MAG: hypothetical protein AABY80_07435 [Candidatus Deferrimicrobiota bacterium]